jgi:replicative superfamily II helicase
MRGRAGRKGKDEIGETYLCCQEEDLEAVVELMTAEIPHVESSLNQTKRGMDRYIYRFAMTIAKVLYLLLNQSTFGGHSNAIGHE